MIAFTILAVLAATPANIDAQFKAAQPGDQVVLSAGTYADIIVKGRVFNPPISVDARAASLGGVEFYNTSGVTWLGGTFHSTAWFGGFYAIGGAHVHASGITIDPNGGPGVTFRDGSDMSLETARIDNSRVAVLVQNVDGFRVVSATMIGMSADGVDVYSSHHGFVGYSLCTAPRTIDTTHKDCVQMADTVVGAPPTSDIEVAFVLVNGDIDGVTSFRPNPGHVRISIHDNTVVTAQPQAVALYDGDAGSSVKNNHVSTIPGSANRASINVIGGAPTHCGNISEAGAGKPGSTDGVCP